MPGRDRLDYMQGASQPICPQISIPFLVALASSRGRRNTSDKPKFKFHKALQKRVPSHLRNSFTEGYNDDVLLCHISCMDGSALSLVVSTCDNVSDGVRVEKRPLNVSHPYNSGGDAKAPTRYDDDASKFLRRWTQQQGRLQRTVVGQVEASAGSVRNRSQRHQSSDRGERCVLFDLQTISRIDFAFLEVRSDD